MEITVILHTTAGDVRTVFLPGYVLVAIDTISQYTLDGKSFSVEQRKF